MSNHYKNRSVWHDSAGRFLIALVCTAYVVVGCHRPEPVSIYGEAQGTYYSVLYFDPLQRNLKPQIDSLLADFDLTASLWVDSSLVRRVNANLTDTLNPLMTELLRHSLYVNRYTDGAFDCRIGRLVQVWGFSFRQREEPSQQTLDSLLHYARGVVGVDTSLSPARIVKQFPQTELDFNAIAQGYASDLLAAYLDRQGITSYLVDIGGEVIARGAKPDGTPWKVGIERPAENRYSDPVVQTVIPLRDISVVTSGSYRKYYEKDGTRYSHTINPATGCPVDHTLLSVSVVEKECWLADAMATAYMVMGLDSARRFIASHDEGPGTGAVLFLYDSCGTLQTYATPDWNKLIQ